MTKINDEYLCVKDSIRWRKHSIYNFHANEYYHCVEIIENVIKVIVTSNSHTFLTFDEFQKHFHCPKESRRKKIDKIKKSIKTD